MAAKARSKRPGSVRWREDRHEFEARVRLPNGSRPSKYFDTEREGWAWIVRTLADAERNVYTSKGNRRTGDVLTEWVEDVAPSTIKANSLYNYRRSIAYVLPSIGRVPIGKLTRADLERAFKGLERENADGRRLSPATLQLAFRVVKMAFEYALDEDYVSKNPMRRMKPPRVAQAKDRVLSVDEIKAILTESQSTRWCGLWWILALTGMRIGEALGLEWKNVDLDTGALHIERQTERVYGSPGVRLGTLKSTASERTVYVPDPVIQVLKWRQDEQTWERKAAQESDEWEEHGLVFTTRTGRPCFRSQPDAAFRRIADRLGIQGATPHTFRHTVATLVQQEGLPLGLAQAQMGHASDRMTNRIYSHFNGPALQQVAVVMQALFGDQESPVPQASLPIPEAR